jgi:D-amino-acid oxidase
VRNESFTTTTILKPTIAGRNHRDLHCNPQMDFSRMPISRRRLLRGATAIAGQLSMPAILAPILAAATDADPASLRAGEILPDPDFSLLRPANPYIIGIRPHREGGVRLELESEPIASPSGPKFLIHNYGHGGAGITLSWGCASVVADHVAALTRDMRRMRMRPSVAVIGSGVIGLTVATELRRRWARLPVTIYAKDVDVRKTTSFKAGGQFEPSGIFEEYETEEQRKVLAGYLRRSRNRIIELHNASHWTRYGIALRRNYTLDHANPAFDAFTPFDVVPKSRTGALPFTKLNMAGREYRTWLINPTILLPQLVADLKRHAVPFRTRTFADKQAFRELRENIIINCTGYGAKALLDDHQLIARRGHLVVLKKTRRKQFYFFSGGCANYRTMYVFCRQNDIVVGGSVQEGNDSETHAPADDAVFRRICDNARNVFDGRPADCRR